MSILTYMQVQRNGALLPGSVSVQLDNISAVVIASSGGAIPNFSYNAYAQGRPDIDQGDTLIDMNPLALDAKTSSGKVEYRVSGLPEFFDYDHAEMMVVRYRERTVYHG